MTMIDSVFAILGIIFACPLVIMNIVMFIIIIAAKMADREFEEEIERGRNG